MGSKKFGPPGWRARGLLTVLWGPLLGLMEITFIHFLFKKKYRMRGETGVAEGETWTKAGGR